jgi:methanethiol S-methyltransferase
MQKVAAVLYGVIAYIIFFATFVYAIAFVGNLYVPKTIDSGSGSFSLSALVIDALLLGLFAIQHSVMARQWFKKGWTRLIPRPIERSTYVLLASLCLVLLFWQWRPMQEVIWSVQAKVAVIALQAGFWLGWGILLISTFLVNHFDLFGLRQVGLFAKGEHYTPIGFKQPAFYRIVRHPIYLGFVIAFWCAPTMTLGHLIFSIATTAYILLAIQFEERDLVSYFGDVYREYRLRTSMLLPIPKGSRGSRVESD